MVERPEYFTVELQLPMETKQKGITTVSPATARIEIIDGMKLLHSHTCMYKYKDHIVGIVNNHLRSVHTGIVSRSFTTTYLYVCKNTHT